MRILILGGGALGTILGAHLASAGHAVEIIARGRRARDLRANGLRVTGQCEVAVACPVVDAITATSHPDLFINTVKTYDSATALALLAHVAPELACSVQNGVLKEAQLAEVFGADAVIGAMADFSGELMGDGSVRFTRNVCLHLGELGGGDSERVSRVVAALDAAGIRAAGARDIVSLEWSKFTGWIALMILAVLTRRPTGDFLRDPDAACLATRITREVAAIAARLRIPLVDVSPVPVPSVLAGDEEQGAAAVRALGERFTRQAPEHRMSSLQDLLNGRRLELEETVGDALARARSLGIGLPTTETGYRLVKAVERGQLAAIAGA